MSHNCHCQSGQRLLHLHGNDFASKYAEIVAFAETTNWKVDIESGEVQIPLSGCGEFTGITAVVNFLRTILSDSQLDALKGAWAAPETEAPVTSAPMQWKPLTEMSKVDSSPLLKILTERKIETWLQPIFLANSLELWGYECLMRGRLDTGEIVPPYKLLEWAKQEQLVFMLDRVCRETHLLNAGKLDIPSHAKLLINFLPTAIYQPEYCLRTTMAAAVKSNIAPERVIFEVIESEEVTDRDHLSNILTYYRNHGFGVALDDMGSGYAGLSLLADLNPDLIKIDRELISRSTTSMLHRKIVEALVRIGAETGKLVLAEGVETMQEMQVVQAAGAHLIQGFLLGKPNPVPAHAHLPLTPRDRRVNAEILQLRSPCRVQRIARPLWLGDARSRRKYR